MLKMDCGVKFEIIIPHDLDKLPYALIISTGKHIHPPPPPTITPTAMVNSLVNLIQRQGDAAITACKSKQIRNLFGACF